MFWDQLGFPCRSLDRVCCDPVKFAMTDEEIHAIAFARNNLATCTLGDGRGTLFRTKIDVGIEICNSYVTLVRCIPLPRDSRTEHMKAHVGALFEADSIH